MRKLIVLLQAACMLPPLQGLAQDSKLASPDHTQRVSASYDEKTLADTLEHYSFNGTALVRAGHERVVVVSTGVANAARQEPATTNTLYQTGSFSKWVASVLVLRLVDQGTLNVHTPVGVYLPEYRPDAGARVTLHHLMSHTSGIPNDMAAALSKTKRVADFAGLSTTDALQRYASGQLAFEPGTRFDYSHSNWLVVEAVLEKTSGMPYRELVRRQLTEPLHLTASGILPADFMVLPHASQAYVTLSPTPQEVARERTAPFPDFVGPFGGFYTSAPDMVRLLDGVLDSRYLSPASLKALWTVNVPTENYAYGGRVAMFTSAGVQHHALRDNNANGAYKSFAFRADDGTTILLFNNTSINQESLNNIADEVLQRLYPKSR